MNQNQIDFMQPFMQEQMMASIEKAMLLREEAEALNRGCGAYDSQDYNSEGFAELAAKYREFERSVVSLEVLYKSYNDIAIAHLNAGDFKGATEYACALINLAKKRKDAEGEAIGINTYGNIAVATGNYYLALKAYRMINASNEGPVLRELIIGAAAQEADPNYAPSFKMPSLEDTRSFSKPASYIFITDPKRQKEEEGIRLIMEQKGIDRKKAQIYTKKQRTTERV